MKRRLCDSFSIHLICIAVLFLRFGSSRCSAEDGSGRVKVEDEPSRFRYETGGLSRLSFPKGFVFGTATSAYQVEGAASEDGKGPSVWDVFVRRPGAILNNDTGKVAADEYHRYKEDVDIMAKMNFDAYRFSISWPRIFPNGVGEVNWEGVAYYDRLINYLLKKGMTPYVNLHHYDTPEALEKQFKGFLSRQIVDAYVNFADFCFKIFGDQVKNWVTFNEPGIVALYGYDPGTAAPGRCSHPYGNCREGDSTREPYIVAHNFILCHAAAVQRYRKRYQATQKGRIGIILDFTWYEPLTDSVTDQQAAQRSRDFEIGWFLHPIVYGEYPKSMQELVGERLPKFSADEINMVKGSMDFVGINHYTSQYAYARKAPLPKSRDYLMDRNAGFTTKRNGVPIGPRAHSNWLYIVPWGIYKVVTYVKEHYGNPTIIISENGMDDPGNETFHRPCVIPRGFIISKPICPNSRRRLMRDVT
ncbi:Beta-glucosidase 44 [Acorus calamus]|uniref:Beta-glucosidase 44 n=1 Tax=Acorus calamus TaxID=4465 RepID=A0AAV9DNR7_ACOCL|nr:Beta-glucosidase 44 [Acorus calamus]